MARKMSERDKQIVGAIYERLRGLYLDQHRVISREEFTHMKFPVVTNWWGLLGIVKEKGLLELIPKEHIHFNAYDIRGRG
jgi:hypothetical protein